MPSQVRMQPLSAKKKTEVRYGDRISREGKIRLGCDVVLFNPSMIPSC